MKSNCRTCRLLIALIIVVSNSLDIVGVRSQPLRRDDRHQGTLAEAAGLASPQVNLDACEIDFAAISVGGEFVTFRQGDGTENSLGIAGAGEGFSQYVARWPLNTQQNQFYKIASGKIGFVSFIAKDTLLVTTTDIQRPKSFAYDRQLNSWQEKRVSPQFQELKTKYDLWSVASADFSVSPYLNPLVHVPTIPKKLDFSEIPTGLIARYRPAISLTGLTAVIGTRDAYVVVGSSSQGQMAVGVFSEPFSEFGIIPSAVNRIGFRNLKLGRLPNGKLAVADMGLLAALDGQEFELVPTPLYANVVQEHSDSAFSYMYGPTSVVSLGSSTKVRSLQREVDRWVAKGWYLDFLDSDTTSGQAIFIFRAAGDTDYAVVLKSGAKSYALRCPSSRKSPPDTVSGSYIGFDSNARVPRPNVAIAFEEVGNSANRLGVWTLSKTRKPRGTIIYLRGGPADTVRGRGLSTFDRSLLNRGYEIIRIDYSGTIQSNPQVYARIREKLAESLQSDATAIIDYVKRRHQSRPIIVLAESFGSALAAQIAKQWNDNIEAIILTSPMATWSFPTKENTSQNSVVQAYMSQVDQFMLGGPLAYGATDEERNKFKSLVESLIEPLCGTKNSHVFVGAFDLKTPPESWNRGCLGAIPRTIVSDAGHGNSPGMNQKLDQFLDEVEAARVRRPHESALNREPSPTSHDPLPPRRH